MSVLLIGDRDACCHRHAPSVEEIRIPCISVDSAEQEKHSFDCNAKRGHRSGTGEDGNWITMWQESCMSTIVSNCLFRSSSSFDISESEWREVENSSTVEQRCRLYSWKGTKDKQWSRVGALVPTLLREFCFRFVWWKQDGTDLLLIERKNQSPCL